MKFNKQKVKAMVMEQLSKQPGFNTEKIEQLFAVFFGTDEHADINKNEIKTINFFDRITYSFIVYLFFFLHTHGYSNLVFHNPSLFFFAKFSYSWYFFFEYLA